MLAFDRTLKYHLVSYRIAPYLRGLTDTKTFKFLLKPFFQQACLIDSMDYVTVIITVVINTFV